MALAGMERDAEACLASEAACGQVVADREAVLGAGEIKPDNALADESTRRASNIERIRLVSECDGDGVRRSTGVLSSATEPGDHGLERILSRET